MADKYSFALDAYKQGFLESLLNVVMRPEAPKPVARIHGDKRANYAISADAISNRTLKMMVQYQMPAATYISEEEIAPRGPECYIFDPFDGSSTYSLLGPNRSVLMSAGMVTKGNKIRAAAVGDIWNEIMYGIDTKGMYSLPAKFFSKEKQRVKIRKADVPLDETVVTMCVPNAQKIDIIYPLFKSVKRILTPRTHLAIADAGCHVAIEPKPEGLWEHIFQLMLGYAGCYFKRLDGAPFELNPYVKQTSIVATNPKVGEQIVNILKGRVPQHHSELECKQ